MKKTTVIIIVVLCAVVLLLCFALALYLAENNMKLCAHKRISEQIIPADCSSGGKTVNTCQRCGYSYESDHTPPADHTLNPIKIPPTCSSSGYTLYYCACSYSFKADVTPPTEHELASEVLAPDCNEQGYTKYFCKNCDYSYNSDFTEPEGHIFKSTTILPTAISAGYTQYTCDCSYSYKGNYVYYSNILESAYTDNTSVLTKGIDVSRWNHQIDPVSGEYLPLDWKRIRSEGFDFVILKAGSTKSGIEPTFEMDYAGAREAGLHIGAYFYTYSLTVEGISKDADSLLLWLDGKKFEYPIYLDLEDSSLSSLGKNHLSKMCETFLCKLQQNGYYTGLYTNHTWLTTILDTARIVTLFDIWYARYPGTSVPSWNEEKYGKQLGMWQYSESGTISGVSGSFDLNYCYKDYPSLMKKWGLNGF